jgi:hypothetical protein
VHLRTCSESQSNVIARQALLVALAAAALGPILAGEALAFDTWRHPYGQPGTAWYRPAPVGPNAAPNGGPNAGGYFGPGAEPRRDPVAAVPPTSRPPVESQRPAAATVQGNLARTPATGRFGRQALTARTSTQLPGRFWHGAQAGRFQPRPFAGIIARRPLIGERGFTGVPPAGETRFLGNEMVLHVAGGVSAQTVDATARRLGLATVTSQSFGLGGGTLFRFRITDGRPVSDVIRAFEAEHIGTAQPNYVFRLQQDATRPAAGAPTQSAPPQTAPSQYVVNKLRLMDVHRVAIGNALVAVIDSEIDAKHPELAGAVVDEFDAIGNHDKPHAHGTGMAGAIAAHRRLIGIAPGVKILAVHAFSSNSTDSAQATSEHILMGIDWAIQKGARIINMSFAGPDDPMLQLALHKAREKGVILIGAAGNLGPNSPPLYPAADPNVIAVTATDMNDKLLPQANQGPYVAIAAPGVDILEPAPNGSYQLTTGTSVAAAHVTGVAALLLDRDPTLDADAIRDLITSTARDPAHKGRNDQLGWGIVDPYRALMAVDTRREAKLLRNRSSTPPPTPAAPNPGPLSAR